MKYHQLDIALAFHLSGEDITIQHEFAEDRVLISKYIHDKLSIITKFTSDLNNIQTKYGNIRLVCTNDKCDMVGLAGIPFFIEREHNNYSEGDILSSLKTTATIRREYDIVKSKYDDGCMIPTTSKSTIVSYIEVIGATKPNDKVEIDTLLIQYLKWSMLGIIQAVVRSVYKVSATSELDKFRTCDIFVNMNNELDPNRSSFHQNKWKRVVYECLEDNPNPGKKCTDNAYIIKIAETFNKNAFTLDKMLKGGR